MELIEQFMSENKCGNRLIYKGSLNSLTTFTRNRLDIPFSVIDVDWLTKYEKWLKSKNNRETTISLLFRTKKSKRSQPQGSFDSYGCDLF